jgi:hypothetical protein
MNTGRMAMLDEGHAEIIAELRRLLHDGDRRHARAQTKVLRRQRDRARNVDVDPSRLVFRQHLACIASTSSISPASDIRSRRKRR